MSNMPENIRRMWEAAANLNEKMLTTSQLTDPKRFSHLSPDREKANVDAVKAAMAKPANKIMQAKIDATAAKRDAKKSDSRPIE